MKRFQLHSDSHSSFKKVSYIAVALSMKLHVAKGDW